MKEYKYISKKGLERNEEKILKELSEHALNGWIVDSVELHNFRLVKGEPQTVRYLLDYPNYIRSKEIYIQRFLDAGWSYIGDLSNLYIFKSTSQTMPISNHYTYAEGYLRRKIEMAVLLFSVSLPTYIIGLYMEQSIQQRIILIFASVFVIASFIWLLWIWRNHRKKKLSS